MAFITALWLPIVLAAVVVFVASSVIHMFLTYHNNDFSKLPDEDAVMNALRPLSMPPGDYVFPYAGGAEAMKSEEFKAKVERGPVAFMTVMEPGAMFNMGPQLAMWFAYCVVVGVFAAYLGDATLGSNPEYLEVFRVTGTVAFACYAMAQPQRSIWFKQNWGTTLRSMFDGLVYASLTGGIFGWLWPM